MATITGFIEKIKFRNEENGYTVLSVTDQSDGDEVIMVGTLSYAAEGDMIQASGRMIEHPVYGEQLQIESYEMKTPQDAESMERYLGSGAIKGIGAALAARIVRHFKADTFRVMEEEPERLSEVKGISEKMAMAIAEQVEEKKGMREAMMFLQNYGITLNLAAKIYQEYGPKLYSIIKENPYKLADDIPGVGFKMADEIAEKVGIFTDSDYRIRAGLLYILLQASANGHTYLPQKELFSQAAELLKVEPTAMEKHLMDMQIDRKVVVKTVPGSEPPEYLVYSSHYYYLELNTARMLHDLNIRGDIPETEIRANLAKVQKKEEIHLDELQEKAVFEAVNSGLLVITGGPGTGKTTTINAIIQYFENEGMEILLAAPTGRAAKRMTETTGYEARTIHRMLELVPSGIPDSGSMSGNNAPSGKNGSFSSGGMHFDRNEENPLDADVIIIDEMSMVDISLMHSLLRAVNVGTRLILVGDVDQLPSVGPGNVLRDIIESGCFNVVKLTHIFRQAAQSDIIVNAHRIHRGEEIALDNQSKDFFCLKRDDSHGVLEVMLWLVRDRMPKYTHCTPFDVQVLTPMKKGELGVHRCNEVLQRYLNPEAPGKNQMELHGVLFREGDKVMQMKNNYQIKWEIRGYNHMMIEEGSGVFNGDCGIITEIDTFNKEVTVRFDDEKYVTYPQGNLDELELAYAITIHKSQGSEYPAVVLPILSGPRPLMNRNILYTAVTRGKKCVTIVGNKDTVREMIQNKSEQMRYSSLCRRLQELEQESLEK